MKAMADQGQPWTRSLCLVILGVRPPRACTWKVEPSYMSAVTSMTLRVDRSHHGVQHHLVVNASVSVADVDEGGEE